MKNIIITILVVLVLGLGGYLVYDNVVNKDESSVVNNNQQNDVVIEQKDAAYFDEYLKAFTKTCYGHTVTKNTENFTNKDISDFVTGYYIVYGIDDGTGDLYYKASVSDVDALIYKYFNKSNIVLETNPYGVITKQDNMYNFKWPAIGCEGDVYRNPVVTYDGVNVTVKYEIYSYLGCLEDEVCSSGKYLTFHLKYNNGNYNVIKIEG